MPAAVSIGGGVGFPDFPREGLGLAAFFAGFAFVAAVFLVAALLDADLVLLMPGIWRERRHGSTLKRAPCEVPHRFATGGLTPGRRKPVGL